MWRQWMVLAEGDRSRRFQKALLGKAWELINFILTVTALGYLFSILFQRDFETYLLYLASGFCSWLLISSVMTEGASVFVRNAVYARELPMPLTVYLWAQLWKSSRAFALNLAIVVLLGLWVNGLSINVLLLIPGVLLLVAISFFMIIVLGSLGAQFRDLIHFMPNVLRGIFFLTPILWTLDRREGLGWLVDYNPFFYLIEVVRSPLMNDVPGASIYLVVLMILVITMAVALFVFSAVRKRLIYWL